MKKTLKWLCIIIVTFIALAYLTRCVKVQWGTYQYSQEIKEIRKNDQLKAEQKAELIKKLDAKKAELQRELTLEETLAEFTPAQAKYYMDGFQIGFPKIYVWGRVVDQHDQPVVKAKVRIVTMGNAFAGGSSGVLYTDEEGYFYIKGAKTTDVGTAIIHPDIARGIGTGADFVFGEPYRDKVDSRNHTSKETAYIYNVFRFDTEILKETKGGGDIGSFKPTGDTYTIDMFKYQSVKKGALDGQLRFRLYKEYDRNEWAKTNWWFEIEAIDGGIQIMDSAEKYPFVAPEAGYQAKIRKEFWVNNPDYQRVWEAKVFFKRNDNSMYGFMNFRVSASADGSGGIRWRYMINPTGSRDMQTNKTDQYGFPMYFLR